MKHSVLMARKHHTDKDLSPNIEDSVLSTRLFIVNMEKSFDLSVVRCKGPTSEDVWMFFLAPPNSRTGCFYFGEDTAKELRHRESAPPKKLDNRFLPLDVNTVSIEKVHTITLPHMGGPNGFSRTINSVLVRDNKSFILDALFALERAFLVPDGTWAKWEDRLVLHLYDGLLTPNGFPIQDLPGREGSGSPSCPALPPDFSDHSQRQRSLTPQNRVKSETAGSARNGRPASKQRSGGPVTTY